MPPLLPLSMAHASAKRWDRHSPEWLGINAQVGDPFHGRSDTGVPRAYASPNRIPACPGAATYAISLNTQALKVAWNK